MSRQAQHALAACRDAYYHIHADPWYTTRWALDLAGSLSIWIGALLYNVACGSEAFKVRQSAAHLRTKLWYTRERSSHALAAQTPRQAPLFTALQAVTGELPAITQDERLREALLGWWPDTIGGALFVLGSWFFWWSAHETPWFTQPGASVGNRLGWWLAAANFLGSVGFFVGAAFGVPIVRVPGLVSNWLELLVGYVIGSALFLVGSYLMIVELASDPS